MSKNRLGGLAAGAAAGAVNGIFGAGGGMVLIPLLGWLTTMEEDERFASSLSIILPICLVSLASTDFIAWSDALPWLPGSALGGALAGIWGKRIPVKWLHRGLGIFIAWGGLRYLG